MSPRILWHPVHWLTLWRPPESSMLCLSVGYLMIAFGRPWEGPSVRVQRVEGAGRVRVAVGLVSVSWWWWL